ncbi:MAG: hypothetical protein GY790_12910 [Bacteroidetes bacterium]|nr:hypothetical protein [Bacteroidota bacterium]
MNYLTPRFVFCSLGCFLLHTGLFSQERWVVPRLESDLVFDGVPDEAAWEKIQAFPMSTFIPTFGLEPEEESVIKLSYDDQYLYLGGMMYVSDPDMVRAFGKKRDLISESCDWLGISIDSYNDKENSLLFFTNPNGIRMDGTIMNDGTPAGDIEPINLNWNTFWDVKSSYNTRGWYTEIRIPLSSLRFQESDNKIIMGINVFRWLPAKNEGSIYPRTPYDWGPYSNMKPSVYAEVEFENLHPKKPLYINPYLLAGFDQFNKLNSTETSYDYSEDIIFEPGLDIKYGINPNTTLDLTFNTDFAQVEADDQQFNLTRFSLVFPEKRQFFLERSSIFDFGLGGPNNLFYSRRIGLHEGEPVRIWGGARLNSRVKDWDIGLLNLQTASLDELPSENFGAFRVKKRILNDYSYTGGMLTSRIGVDGSYNIAYGLDAVLRLFGDDYLTVRWAQTFSDSTRNNPLSLDPTRFLVSWEKRKQEGFTYNLLFTRSGTDFEPGIGLEIFQNYYASAEILSYMWISPGESPLQDHNISLTNYHLNDVSSGNLLTWRSSPGWTFTSKGAWTGSLTLIYNYENLVEDFEILDPVVVPIGKYHFVNTSLMLKTPGKNQVSALFLFEGGGFYDGLKFSPSVEPSLKFGASLELGGIYRFDHVRFPDRNQSLNNHIAGVRALFMLSTKISFSAFLQYNTAIEKVIANFRFRYNPREGTDLYLVYNEGRNTYLQRETPNLPPYDQRNITLKFSYTFRLSPEY